MVSPERKLTLGLHQLRKVFQGDERLRVVSQLLEQRRLAKRIDQRLGRAPGDGRVERPPWTGDDSEQTKHKEDG
jgi:hypothetical protein